MRNCPPRLRLPANLRYQMGGDRCPKSWFYARGGVQQGPMSLENLRAKLATDGNLAEALVWRDGFDGWKRAPEVQELYPKAPTPPPLPEDDAGVLRTKSGSSEKKWSSSLVGKLVSIGSALVGIALAKAFGATFWMPAALIALAWFVLSKMRAHELMIPMLAFMLGHTTWMVVGSGLLIYLNGWSADNSWFLVDVVVVVGLTIWGLRAPSWRSSGGVLVYQIAALGMGALDMAYGGGVKISSLSAQSIMLAQVMHILLRVIGIGLAIQGVIAFARKRASI